MFCIVQEKIKRKMNRITLAGPSDELEFSPEFHLLALLSNYCKFSRRSWRYLSKKNASRVAFRKV